MHQTHTGGLVPPKPPMAARQVAMGARHHFSGTLIVGEDEGQAVDVESHLEMQVALVMLARRDVVDLETQVPCQYVDAHGRMQWHFCDFRVGLRDGTRVVILVKPAEKAQRPAFRDIVARIAARRLVQNIAGAVRIETLVRKLDADGCGFRAIVRLLRCHELELAQHVRISPDAFVRRSMT